MHSDLCYEMPSRAASGSGELTYDFGLDPRSERLPLSNGGSWIFFSATFSAGGSGALERIAVLRYEADGGSGKIVNLMPYVAVTNESDRAMWDVPTASAYPVLVLADFVWGDGEPHFGAHYFTVEAWRFNATVDHYVKAFSYRTTKRYSGLDSTDQVRVLIPERAEVIRRLAGK